jgi:hypothetical protein
VWGFGKKPAKYSFLAKLRLRGVKSSNGADFTIKNVPLQTILCGFVKVRLNNF